MQDACMLQICTVHSFQEALVLHSTRSVAAVAAVAAATVYVLVPLSG